MVVDRVHQLPQRRPGAVAGRAGRARAEAGREVRWPHCFEQKRRETWGFGQHNFNMFILMMINMINIKIAFFFPRSGDLTAKKQNKKKRHKKVKSGFAHHQTCGFCFRDRYGDVTDKHWTLANKKRTHDSHDQLVNPREQVHVFLFIKRRLLCVRKEMAV